jgi:hypothetical protein
LMILAAWTLPDIIFFVGFAIFSVSIVLSLIVALESSNGITVDIC